MPRPQAGLTRYDRDGLEDTIAVRQTPVIRWNLLRRLTVNQGHAVRSSFRAAKYQGAVSATEPERIGRHAIDTRLSGLPGDIVEIMTIIRVIQINGRGQDLVTQRQDAENRLNAPRGT